MSRIATFRLPLTVTACGLLLVGTAHAQNEESRREYFTPGLVVETTGARRGACDVLTFTDDGKYLLAAGDDKVVRVWRFSPARGLEPAELPMLRWPSWHESRGNIYALAMSPNGNRYVAVGGQGMSSGGDSIAVFDRSTGAILHTFPPSKGAVTTKRGTTWSMAFAPSGKQVAYGTQHGSIWLWDLTAAPKAEPIKLGQHAGGKDVYVKLLRYLPDGRLLSASSKGEVLVWDAPVTPGNQRRLFNFTTPMVYRVAISPDGRWLAAASEAPDHRYVELRNLNDETQNKKLDLASHHWAHNLTFSADSKRLAVGVRVVSPPESGDPFYRETVDGVYLYTLGKDTNLRLLRNVQPTYHTESLAFHPDGRHLAIAGGDDHEVTVWNMDRQTQVSKIVGPGKGLWSVALSGDGRYLAFKDKRNRFPATPNDRGAGDWAFFDLEKRRWAPDNAFVPARAAASEGGWVLRTSLPRNLQGAGLPPVEERQNERIWFVQSPEGDIYKLPLNPERDWLPRCYAFLPAVPAKDGKPAQPVRLAVGHLWGVTVFDLTGKGPIPRRMFAGHEGEVMALALSADHERLVTVSRDETVAGWNLADWPGQRELGARFSLNAGRLWVGKVAAGSPAWEAGLSENDEILGLVVAPSRRPLFNHGVGLKHWGPDVGTAKAALEALENAKPGMEHYFAWRRQGKVIEQLTSVRQRPLWRFFPTRDREWVLWRWRDYYYDTSTKGDYLIGWQRNHTDLRKVPEFYKAEQFRHEYHKPERVAAMLRNWKEAPAKSAFLELEPPKVTIEVAAGKAPGGVTALLTATPRGERENQKLARVVLWVNDYQFKVWEGDALTKTVKDGIFHATELIPRDKLRRGDNPVTLQAYNRGDVRDQAEPVKIANPGPPPVPDLYGVFIGIGRYSRARIGKQRLADLLANDDARAMYRLWRGSAGGLYRNVHLAKPLLDGDATRPAILKQLADLVGKVKPDDRLIFHIGGHGTRPAELATIINRLKLPKKQHDDHMKQLDGLGKFLFCCADFDIANLSETTVGFDELYKELVKLPCHKILLLDACHAGDTRAGLESEAVNPIRVMTPAGVGPIIFAACQPHESAYEDPNIDAAAANGLFTIAIRRTLEEDFDTADKNKDKILEPNELFDNVKVEVDQLMRRLRKLGRRTAADEQTPYAWLPALEMGLRLVRRPETK